MENVTQEETITPTERVTDTAVGESAHVRRRTVVQLYTKANGREKIEEVLADVKRDLGL